MVKEEKGVVCLWTFLTMASTMQLCSSRALRKGEEYGSDALSYAVE